MLQLLASPHRPVAVFAQSVAAAVLTKMGYQLAMPSDATLPVDLLGSRDPELRTWQKFQVKQASASGVVGLRRGDKGPGCKVYRAGDFDVLVVVDLTAGVFLIPYRAIQHLRSQVCVRDPLYHAYRVMGPVPDIQAAPLVHRVPVHQDCEQIHLFPARIA
jgi:hypothetical protein